MTLLKFVTSTKHKQRATVHQRQRQRPSTTNTTPHLNTDHDDHDDHHHRHIQHPTVPKWGATHTQGAQTAVFYHRLGCHSCITTTTPAVAAAAAGGIAVAGIVGPIAGIAAAGLEK